MPGFSGFQARGLVAVRRSRGAYCGNRDFAANPFTILKRERRRTKMKAREPIQLEVEELEERIAPDATGNPGNNNPALNNTNNPGNEGTGGHVSTGP